MILGISSLLIEHLKRLPIQLGELSLEPDPKNLRHHHIPLLPVPLPAIMIILHKHTQAVRVAKRGPLDRDLLHVVCARDGQRLGRGDVGAGGEVEVVVVAVEVEGAGAGGGVGGADEEGVEFEDTGEAVWWVRFIPGLVCFVFFK